MLYPVAVEAEGRGLGTLAVRGSTVGLYEVPSSQVILSFCEYYLLGLTSCVVHGEKSTSSHRQGGSWHF